MELSPLRASFPSAHSRVRKPLGASGLFVVSVTMGIVSDLSLTGDRHSIVWAEIRWSGYNFLKYQIQLTHVASY